MATSNRERGFGLIEVIVAMIVLSVVVSGAAMAVVSGDSAEVRVKAVADSHAMAEKAVERLRNDLTARAGCDAGSAGTQGWIATARATKTSGSPAAADFAPCLVNYNDMRDAKGRGYRVSLVVEAQDRVDDGVGAQDTDGDLRDAYEVETSVVMAADSTAGRESMAPVRVGGTVDWEGGSTDDATIRVIACAIDRPDRALMAGGCTTTDTSRQPVTVTLSVKRVNEESGTTASAGTITSGGAAAPITPGAYRFTAPTTVGSFRLLKLDPADLRVHGSQNYVIHATYVRAAVTTRVCTQVANWNGPYDDGYEVLATNLHWRRTEQAGFRSTRLPINGDGNPAPGAQTPNRTWNCSRVLLDPVEPTQNLFRGVYDIEVEQVNRRGSPAYTGLRVMQASLDCSLANWNSPMGGTALYSRTRDGSLERPHSWDRNRDSFYARMAIPGSPAGHRLCLRFYSKQFERAVCPPYYPHTKTVYYVAYDADGNPYTASYETTDYDRPEYEAGCFYEGPSCSLPSGVVDNDGNCYNGAEMCVSNCDSTTTAPAGTAGAVELSSTSGGVTGGPNDTTVACTPQSGYVWPGSRLHGQGMGTLVAMSTIQGHNWVGGDSGYYATHSGRTMARKSHPYGVHPDAHTYNLPDHPAYHCNDVYFTAPKSMLLGSWKLYTCIEVHVPGRPHLRIRGRILDQSGISGSTLYTTVGGALALAPDSGKMQNHWNPFGGPNSYPHVTSGNPSTWPVYNVAKVSGDPVCNSGSSGAPVYQHYDPIITDVWKKVVDDPLIYPLNPPPYVTNMGRDRLGV